MEENNQNGSKSVFPSNPNAVTVEGKDNDSLIDEMNREVDILKEKLKKLSTRTHILQVDLATQFSPHTVEALRNVKEDCQRCSSKIQHLNPIQ